MKMKAESFGICLQRVLAEVGTSASEASRMVGFRSRNSIFRILNDETSWEVDARFLSALKQVAGEEWTPEHWHALDTALEVKRVGPEQYQSNQAFSEWLHVPEKDTSYWVETSWPDRGQSAEPVRLEHLLQLLSADAELSITMCGCCERSLTALLAQVLGAAGEHRQAEMIHYVDVQPAQAVQNILGILPLIGRRWYSARLVEDDGCTPEMAALYRMNMICIRQRRNGASWWHQLIRYDSVHFIHTWSEEEVFPLADAMKKGCSGLDELRPLVQLEDGPQAYVDYTAQYAKLESDGIILSIKPDLHFNCVPSHLLYQAVLDGFEREGVAAGPELEELLSALKDIHDMRYNSIFCKRRPTYLVYSIAAMERFMRTGVQTDHFFMQRAYTEQERREVLGQLYHQMQENPYFNVRFLKPELPEIRNEVTFYQDKGVLLMDAYTGYALHEDHAEALITLPLFMQRYQQFFMDEILTRYVLSESETLAVFERLLR